jgi:hypothetical protein
MDNLCNVNKFTIQLKNKAVMVVAAAAVVVVVVVFVVVKVWNGIIFQHV